MLSLGASGGTKRQQGDTMPKRSSVAPPAHVPCGLEPLEPRVLLSTLDPANPVARIQTDYGEIEVELYMRGSSAAAAADAQVAMLDIFDGRADRATWQESGGELSLILPGEVLLGFDGLGMVYDRLGGPGSSDALGCVVSGLNVLTQLTGAVATPTPFAVRVIDIEVIKPEGGARYTHILAYPEGYRADTVNERIQITNVNVSPVDYQIIARFERGWRDQVLAFGTLEGTSVRSISLSDPALSLAPGAPLTPNASRLPWANLPYAIEIHASGAIGASFQHEDFGAEIGEDFFAYVADGDKLLPAFHLRKWSMAGVNAGASLPDLTRLPFLLLYNPTAQIATIRIDFYQSRTPNSPSASVTQQLGPYRRGGLEIFSLLGANQHVMIDVISNREVLAALSSYEQRTSVGPAPVLTETAVGSMLNIGATTGYLPGVRLGPGSVYFMESEPQPPPMSTQIPQPFVSASLIDSSGRVMPFPEDLWERIDLEEVRQSLGLPVGEIVTLRFSSIYNVRGYYVSENPSGSGLGGAVAMPFYDMFSEGVIFSGGQLDLADPSQQEFLTLYGEGDEASIRIFFSDGTSVDLPSIMLGSGESITLDLGTLPEITTKLMANPDLTYSLLVTSSGMWAPLAQFTRIDGSSGAAWSSRGTLFGEIDVN
jgi:hypothetical protein